MGLFSFLKKAGAKLTNPAPKTSESAPAAPAPEIDFEEIENQQKEILLTGVINNLNFDVQHLNVNVEGDHVRIVGVVETQAEKEKVILSLGNVSGVSSVEDKLAVIQTKPEAQFYEVQSGDSLSKIAKHFYGDAGKYMKIFEANQPLLKDPNLIHPGQSLRIPAE